jgi:hypothetical protein
MSNSIRSLRWVWTKDVKMMQFYELWSSTSAPTQLSPHYWAHIPRTAQFFILTLPLVHVICDQNSSTNLDGFFVTTSRCKTQCKLLRKHPTKQGRKTKHTHTHTHTHIGLQKSLSSWSIVFKAKGCLLHI